MILNLFKPSEEKVKLRIEKEAKNIMKEHDKYAREGALYYLKSQADNPEALVALLNRFEVNISPSTLDQREKNSVVEIFTKIDKAMAINTLKSFIKTADNVAKPCAILRELDDEACEFLISVLESIGSGYARNPEKKKILLRGL